MRSTPASFSAWTLSSSIRPSEQQILISTRLLISRTTPEISWISFAVGPRPLLTMQKRTAPAALALSAPSINFSLLRNGYLSIGAWETDDCEQNWQSSGQRPRLAFLGVW